MCVLSSSSRVVICDRVIKHACIRLYVINIYRINYYHVAYQLYSDEILLVPRSQVEKKKGLIWASK